MMDKVSPRTLGSVETFRVKFAPVLALKSAAQEMPLTAKPLSVTEQQQAWDALVTVVPEVLAQCSGITTQTDQKDTFFTLVLWDFFNGREICVSVDKRCGYNLSIRAEEIRWMETQLPLDLIFLKLLALDYTPEEFRALAG
ncbi:hypothetical protein KMP13_10500 [Epibacterium ulvae]|uniref:hypothetical protein n=1 Tax=Epibacterium ulvae TaxID=1156985 RepID=UPI001BFC8AC9|nr:hypothetical protein [Epibacterium ulvae]MBT8154321.1 hypothetical protein [Epibacterium ulvae]